MQAKAFLALLPFASGAWACSCSAGYLAPACETYFTNGVLFLGTVLDHHGHDLDGFTHAKLYRVRVDERFRGLERADTEVFVDSGIATSCSTSYDTGKQYLFVGSRSAFHPLIKLPDGSRPKPPPRHWVSKLNLKAVTAALCSPTRPAGDAVQDLAWLRDQVRGAPNTRVYGRALQNSHNFWRELPDEDMDVPLPGAQVFLEGNGRRFATSADAGGSYLFVGVPPGSYYLRAERRPWISSAAIPVNLTHGGCAERHLSLGSQGELRGTVLDHRGIPAPKISVDLVRRRTDGHLTNWPVATARTAADGSFVLEHLAAETYVLGVNLVSPPTIFEPYLPTYYPGSVTLTGARHITLPPHEKLRGLFLLLPPPLPRRRVTVQASWADGNAVRDGVGADAWLGDAGVAFQSVRRGNQVHLDLLEGLSYRIGASWERRDGDLVRRVRSDRVVVPAGAGSVTVNVRFKENRP